MATILIADDSSFQRMHLRRVIRQQGHRTVEADNGDAALRLIREHQLDGILLDLVMPGTDGFAVLEGIRAGGCSAPVLVITADIQKSVRARCLSLGAQAVLTKPIAEADLIEALASILPAVPGAVNAQ